jgi:hypothetical protein
MRSLINSIHLTKQIGKYALLMVALPVYRFHAVDGEPNCFLQDANYGNI